MFCVASLLVASCGPHETACQADRFFCRNITLWESSASKLPTERVMELHALDWKHNRPPSGIFARVLGQRGDESLRSLIMFLENHPEFRHQTFYIPVIREVEFGSGLNICKSEYRRRMSKVTGGRIELYCNSG